MLPSKILIPVDGSPASLRAVDFAIPMAAQNPDSLFVLLNVQNVSATELSGEFMHGVDDDECSAAFDEEYGVGVRGHWAFAAMAALIPIPVVWVLVHILVWTVRWMRRGLQAST